MAAAEAAGSHDLEGRNLRKGWTEISDRKRGIDARMTPEFLPLGLNALVRRDHQEKAKDAESPQDVHSGRPCQCHVPASHWPCLHKVHNITVAPLFYCTCMTDTAHAACALDHVMGTAGPEPCDGD